MHEDWSKSRGSKSNDYEIFSPLAQALYIADEDEEPEVIERTDTYHSCKDSKAGIGKYVAIDCEYVGVGHSNRSALARVSIVNYYGYTLMDEYVVPEGRVTDWRTWVSGVTPNQMTSAISFNEARQRVARIIKKRCLVGHSLSQDLKVLRLTHVYCEDISKFDYGCKIVNGRTPGLRALCKYLLNYDIQKGEHSLVEDAEAAMAIFRVYLYRQNYNY